MAPVEDGAGEDGGESEEEALHGADPGDGAGGVGGEEGIGVVGLEDAEGGDCSPGIVNSMLA